MSKEQPKKKETKQKGGEFIIRFSKNDVGASIFLKTASAGFKYLAYSLSRSYEVGEDTRYSTDFYDYNAAGLADVVIRASTFIQENKDNPEGAAEAAEAINAKRQAKRVERANAKKQHQPNGAAQVAAPAGAPF